MEGKGGAEAAETEAERRHKQSGTKAGKNQAQKDAHNKSCRQSRQKIKMRREELEQEVPKLQTENKKMKIELEEKKSTIGDMENDIQKLKRTLKEKTANEERMRQILIGLKINGQNFTSFDENYVQDSQVPGTSVNVLPHGNEFVGLGEIGTVDFSPPMADFYQQMGSDQDYTDITAYAAFGSSSDANHYLPFVLDTPNSHANKAGVLINSAAGSSFGANHDLPELPAMNNLDNLFNGDLAAVLTNSAAGSSLGANPELENDGDLFTPLMQDFSFAKIHLQRQFGNDLH